MPVTLQGAGAFIIFVAVLAAYTLQTELASVVQRTYTKPYFLLYLTHSSYVVLFPLHLILLHFTGTPLRPLLHQLRDVLKAQLTSSLFSSDSPSSAFGSLSEPFKGTLNADDDEIEEELEMGFPHNNASALQAVRRRIGGRAFPWRRLGRLVLALTIMIAVPAGSWYIAVPLTTMPDITALYNSNAFFAYVFSIFLKLEAWDRRRGLAVLLAVIGVFVIAYGDQSSASSSAEPEKGAASRFFGNMLALFGSVSYAAYEVWYKKYAALPEPAEEGDEESERPGVARRVSRASLMNGNGQGRASDEIVGGSSMSRSSSRNGYQGVAREEDTVESPSRRPSSPTPLERPSPTLFLLHADLLTSLIGLFTIFLLLIPLPFLSIFSLEPFELPPADLIPAILGIMAGGVIFNGGFMILLGLWGPIVASVGNLCTLVLVVVADAYVSEDKSWPSGWGLIGIGLITGAFAVLVGEMFRGQDR